MKILRT